MRASPGSQQPESVSHWFLFGEDHFAVANINSNAVPRDKIAPDNVLCQRILDPVLNRPTQWPGPIDRVIAQIRNAIQDGVCDFEIQLVILQTATQQGNLNIGDSPDLCTAQWLEYHRLIDAVDKFRTE